MLEDVESKARQLRQYLDGTAHPSPARTQDLLNVLRATVERHGASLGTLAAVDSALAAVQAVHDGTGSLTDLRQQATAAVQAVVTEFDAHGAYAGGL